MLYAHPLAINSDLHIDHYLTFYKSYVISDTRRDTCNTREINTTLLKEKWKASTTEEAQRHIARRMWRTGWSE